MSSIPKEIIQKLIRIQNRLQQADALEKAHRVDEAMAAYLDCFTIATQERIPLIDNQLAHIWTGIGFCYADKNDWKQALKWYHRAEANLLSSPEFNPDPESPKAKASAKKWSSYLPDGVNMVFRKDFSAKEHLAELWDSIALAYDNDNQVERANEYFQRSIKLHNKLNHPEREAMVQNHQAVGYQRRQQWFELEQAAETMLGTAKRADSKFLMLDARRLLAQSQINQNRPFKTLEHMGHVVTLARELSDPKLSVEENLLTDLVDHMRNGVLDRGEADFLEPLVNAEAIVNHPRLSQDRELLQKLQSEQSPSIQPGSLPDGKLDSLLLVAMVLNHFALRHLGAPTQKEKMQKKGVFGIIGGSEKIVERRVWAINQEEMQVFHKDEFGKPINRMVTSAVLTIFGQPEVIISVSITDSECNVAIMEERSLPGVRQTGFFSVARESIAPDSEALLKCLNSFIQRGLFRKTEKGLIFVSPKHN